MGLDAFERYVGFLIDVWVMSNPSPPQPAAGRS